jgi:hypothetical protein
MLERPRTTQHMAVCFFVRDNIVHMLVKDYKGGAKTGRDQGGAEEGSSTSAAASHKPAHLSLSLLRQRNKKIPSTNPPSLN